MIAPCGVNSTGNFWTGGSFSVHYYPPDLPVTAAALEGGRASDSLSHATHFVRVLYLNALIEMPFSAFRISLL